MRKTSIVLILGALFWLGEAREARAATELDYYGDNLFLGMAYHRWACAVNPYNGTTWPVASNNTYQGFTATQHCFAGQAYNAVTHDIYLGYTETSARGHSEESGWYGYYYCYANWNYGLALSGYDATNSNNYCHSWRTGYQNNSTAGVVNRSSSGAPNACGYNVMTDCNSDCWIRDFSQREGWAVEIASGCW